MDSVAYQKMDGLVCSLSCFKLRPFFVINLFCLIALPINFGEIRFSKGVAPHSLALGLNHRAVRNHGVLRDDHDAVADEIKLVIHVFRLAGGRDGHVVPDACVFVNDGILDLAMFADADARLAFALILRDGFRRLVIVAAEDDDAVQFRTRADNRAQADDRAVDGSAVDDAAV
jgi:hypothetical protein